MIHATVVKCCKCVIARVEWVISFLLPTSTADGAGHSASTAGTGIGEDQGEPYRTS